jgi:hypothetical protein
MSSREGGSVGGKRRITSERAREWVRNNGYDSSSAEGLKFFQAMEQAAEASDFEAECWVPGAKAEAGRQELLRAANAERIRVPTRAGPRRTPVRGSVPVQGVEQVWHQRSLFLDMSVGRYRYWLSRLVRNHTREDGVIAAHTRVLSMVDVFPDDTRVGDALTELGLAWDELMQDAA